jgi:hypothetical protein
MTQRARRSIRRKTGSCARYRVSLLTHPADVQLRRQSLALWSSVFLIVNWIFAVAFDPPPRVLADNIFYYGVEAVLTLPVLFMVMYDWPRDRPVFYQIYLSVQVWSWCG